MRQPGESPGTMAIRSEHNMTTDLATRLFNIAVWHLEQADKSSSKRDHDRHIDISDRIFIRAYWLRRAA